MTMLPRLAWLAIARTPCNPRGEARTRGMNFP